MTRGQYRDAREALHLTQEELAALLGVTFMTISRRERGTVPITKEAELALMKIGEMLDDFAIVRTKAELRVYPISDEAKALKRFKGFWDESSSAYVFKLPGQEADGDELLVHIHAMGWTTRES